MTATTASDGDHDNAAQQVNDRVDVHHHFFTPHFIEVARERFEREVSGMPLAAGVLKWTIQDSIDGMDAAGVATAMLSLNNPGPVTGDVQESRALTRHCNDYAAQAQSDYPGRFGHFASLPLPDIEGSLREIEYALDTLGADGFIVHTNDSDIWLGDERFWPVYEELNRRKTVVYVHPATPGCCQNVPIASPPALLEYRFDTARAITNLIFSGAAARFPDIKFIFSHGGGAMLAVFDRLDQITRVRPDLAHHMTEGAPAALAKFYYDTAQVFNPVVFGALRALLPLDNILFGTDIPFASLPVCVQQLAKLIPDIDERRAIERSNAVAILPQLDEALRRIPSR